MLTCFTFDWCSFCTSIAEDDVLGFLRPHLKFLKKLQLLRILLLWLTTLNLLPHVLRQLFWTSSCSTRKPHMILAPLWPTFQWIILTFHFNVIFRTTFAFLPSVLTQLRIWILVPHIFKHSWRFYPTWSRGTCSPNKPRYIPSCCCANLDIKFWPYLRPDLCIKNVTFPSREESQVTHQFASFSISIYISNYPIIELSLRFYLSFIRFILNSRFPSPYLWTYPSPCCFDPIGIRGGCWLKAVRCVLHVESVASASLVRFRLRF